MQIKQCLFQQHIHTLISHFVRCTCSARKYLISHSHCNNSVQTWSRLQLGFDPPCNTKKVFDLQWIYFSFSNTPPIMKAHLDGQKKTQ